MSPKASTPPAEGRARIVFDAVSIARDGRAVLKDFSWATRGGEHWFIMGPNGCGKTTLMEMIMGYLWPSEGRLSVLGQTFGEAYLPDLRRRIGYVSPWIFKHTPQDCPCEAVIASGTEASAGLLRAITRGQKRRARAMLKFLGVADLAERPFGAISSGQQLKVIVGRALISRPRILILDEPFSMLDPGARAGLYRILDRLALPGGPQLLLVTHHREDITAAFTHGLLLRDGGAYAQGPKEQLFAARRIERLFGLRAATGLP